jgi:Flp pilus assembly protein TadG
MTYTRSGCPTLRAKALNRLRKRRVTASRAGRTRARGESGQALVEFALILLPTLMLIFGIIKFGILFNNYVTLTNATAYGARVLAVNRGAGSGPPNACSLAETALDSSATTLVSSQISPSITFPSPDTSTCNELVSGDSASFTATYPCNLQILFLNVWPSCTLTAQTTIRIE